LLVERFGEDVEATAKIVNVTLARAVCFFGGNVVGNQCRRRDAAFARLQICDEKVCRVGKRPAVWHEALSAFLRHLAQPGRKFAPFDAVAFQLGIFETAESVRLIVHLEEGAFAFSVLPMVDYKFQTGMPISPDGELSSSHRSNHCRLIATYARKIALKCVFSCQNESDTRTREKACFYL